MPKKAGTHGRFMVEVSDGEHGIHRLLARRFVTIEEAEDFHTRAVAAHQAKADREHRWYTVALYETATPKSTQNIKDHKTTKVVPL